MAAVCAICHRIPIPSVSTLSGRTLSSSQTRRLGLPRALPHPPFAQAFGRRKHTQHTVEDVAGGGRAAISGPAQVEP